MGEDGEDGNGGPPVNVVNWLLPEALLPLLRLLSGGFVFDRGDVPTPLVVTTGKGASACCGFRLDLLAFVVCEFVVTAISGIELAVDDGGWRGSERQTKRT